MTVGELICVIVAIAACIGIGVAAWSYIGMGKRRTAVRRLDK